MKKKEKIVAAPAEKKTKSLKKDIMAKAKKLIDEETSVASKPDPIKSSKKASAKKTSTGKRVTANKPLLPEKSKEETVTINNHELKFTNLDKIYFSQTKNNQKRCIELLLPGCTIHHALHERPTAVA